MDRRRRLTLAGFALTLLTTLLAGFERLGNGKTAQGLLFFAGAAIGIFVYLRRRRREARAETTVAAAAPGDERGGDV